MADLLDPVKTFPNSFDTFSAPTTNGFRGIYINSSGAVNSNLATNLKDVVGNSLWLEQLKAMALTLVLSVVATVVIAYVVKALLGLRPSVEAEQEGLDLSDHGEEGYIYESKS